MMYSYKRHNKKHRHHHHHHDNPAQLRGKFKNIKEFFNKNLKIDKKIHPDVICAQVASTWCLATTMCICLALAVVTIVISFSVIHNQPVTTTVLGSSNPSSPSPSPSPSPTITPGGSGSSNSVSNPTVTQNITIHNHDYASESSGGGGGGGTTGGGGGGDSANTFNPIIHNNFTINNEASNAGSGGGGSSGGSSNTNGIQPIINVTNNNYINFTTGDVSVNTSTGDTNVESHGGSGGNATSQGGSVGDTNIESHGGSGGNATSQGGTGGGDSNTGDSTSPSAAISGKASSNTFNSTIIVSPIVNISVNISGHGGGQSTIEDSGNAQGGSGGNATSTSTSYGSNSSATGINATQDHSGNAMSSGNGGGGGGGISPNDIKQAKDVLIIPPGGSIEASGYTISVISHEANYMCYTVNGSNPKCGMFDCDIGNNLAGSSNVINIQPSILKIVGCAMVHSPISTVEFIESKNAGTVVFDPPDLSYLQSHSTVYLTSDFSKSICYTMTDDNPVCENHGDNCKRGIHIIGDGGTTNAILSDTTIKAVGCVDKTSTPVAGINSEITSSQYFITKVASDVYFIPSDNTIITKGMTIFMASDNAKSICYTIDDSIPSCQTDGNSCSHGTYIDGNSGVTGHIQTNTTVKSIACVNTASDPPGVNSDVTVSNYIIQDIVQDIEIPSFNYGVGIPVPEPPSSSTIQFGGSVELDSENATSICYTFTGAIPVCTPNGMGCMSGGININGEVGSTIALYSTTQIYAKGCKPEPTLLSRNRNKEYQRMRRKRKKNKFRSMTDVMHAVYFIAQQVEEVQFIPGDQSVIFNGMTISISAPKAKSICYSDATIIPACTPDGLGCLAGNRIPGSNGVTMGLTEDTTLRAIGCTDTTSTPAAGINSMLKEATYSVYTTFTNPTDEEEEEEQEEGFLRSNSTHSVPYSNISTQALNAPVITQNAAPININITLGGGYMQGEHLPVYEDEDGGHHHGSINTPTESPTNSFSPSPSPTNVHARYNCSEGTFICPSGYFCDPIEAIFGERYGCVKNVEILNVSTVITNTLVAVSRFIQIHVVGNGYFPVEIPISENKTRIALTRMGEFFIDNDGYIKDIIGFKIYPNIYIENTTEMVELYIHNNGSISLNNNTGPILGNIQLAIVPNKHALDLLHIYPFFIDCTSVLCPTEALDEKPVWYYVSTPDSGNITYLTPNLNEMGYLDSGAQFSERDLFVGGVQPDYNN